MPRKRKKQKSQYQILQQRWLKRHRQARRRLLKKHKEAIDWVTENVPAKEHLASGAIGALMIANALPSAVAAPDLTSVHVKEAPIEQKVDKKAELVSYLSTILPSQLRPLTREEEVAIGQRLSHDFAMNVTASLEDKSLNRSYGYIGAEQHLTRFPGDTMASHLPIEVAKDRTIYSSGMAPGRGAWGYFAKSRKELNEKDVEREKWYIAVQTFLSPGFLDNVKDHYEWFKYRKMLVVNPKTGQAAVCDIADAGPAHWTGKHLGGSPEVMYELGLHTGVRKGAVLYFFIDDFEDKISLGPINLNQ